MKFCLCYTCVVFVVCSLDCSSPRYRQMKLSLWYKPIFIQFLCVKKCLFSIQVLALGMVFPFWMMSGVFWPLESIKNPMQRIFWMMPLSYPIRSIDQIVKRGWSYEHASVQLGYFTSLLYNGVLLVANVVAFNLTSK